MGPILGALNVVALSLCAYLTAKAKLDKNPKDPYLRSSNFPLFHEFYRGMELHPRLLGVDVKQLTNCRMGMMMWQLLIIINFVAAYHLKGFDAGHLANVTLQTIYIYKFYRWETGYFNTLDITLDRAGYYICWGCLVWIPSFYTFSSYFFVYHQPHCSLSSALVIFVVGIGMIYLNYNVDRQKEIFCTAKGRAIKIWGKEAEGLKVSYTTAAGDKKTTNLLVSGWWGLARKINYTFELLAALTWSIPAGFHYGIWPFLYFLFLLILLVHRIFRDEEKCKNKYGNGWVQYCKRVPYRLIPHVF
jgi:7-dehydrocholesterol reductase